MKDDRAQHSVAAHVYIINCRPTDHFWQENIDQTWAGWSLIQGLDHEHVKCG